MSQDWPKLKPIDELERPPFPVDIFPDQVRRYIEAVSESYQVPPDLVGNLVLVAGSVAINKRFFVQVIPDWIEPCNLYVAVALPPGHRKSPVFNEVMGPIEAFEESLRRKAGPRLESRRAERDVFQSLLKNAKVDAIKAAPEDRTQAMRAVLDIQQQMPERLYVPRIIADNATQESLISLLAENQGRMAMLSPEGGIFALMDGHYSRSGSVEIDVYLKAHSGDDIRCDRVSRDHERVPKPSLVLGLALQPKVLMEMVRNPAFTNRGFQARFLFSCPHAPLGNRLIDAPSVLPPTRNAYENVITRLFGHSFSPEGEWLDHKSLLQLDSEAQKVFGAYRQQNELALAPGGRLACIADWGNKLCGATTRLMGVLHAFQYPEAPMDYPISADVVRGAVRLAQYYEAHALIVFGSVSSTISAEAIELLDMVVDRLGREFSARDAFGVVRSSRFHSMDVIRPLLELLANEGCIRRLPDPERTGPGQKPSPRYEVHPDIITRNTQNARNIGGVAIL